MWYICAISNVIIGNNNIPCNPAIMGQLAGCLPQFWHRDAKSGYFLIQALTDNYKFGVIPGYHIISVTDSLTFNNPETVNFRLPPIIVTL